MDIRYLPIANAAQRIVSNITGVYIPTEEGEEGGGSSDAGYFRIVNTYAGDNVLTTTKNGDMTSTDLQYSLDGENWTDFDLTQYQTTITIPEEGTLYWRSSTGFAGATDGYYFNMKLSQSHTVCGDLRTLIDYTDVDSVTEIPNNAFNSLFNGNTTLTSAAGLSFGDITTVGENGCRGMFAGCGNMTQGPDLSKITTVGKNGFYLMFSSSGVTSADLSGITSVAESGCNSMFQYTPNLVSVNLTLPSVIEKLAFNGMFNSANSFTSVPDFSNVTTIGQEGCSSILNHTAIASTPDMSSVTNVGTDGLKFAFADTNISAAPDLSGLTSIASNGLYGAFYGCGNLTTGLDLRNVTRVNSKGLYQMYYNCTSLTTVYAPVVNSWSSTNTRDWLYNVASSGTLYKSAELEKTAQEMGAPAGWTAVNYE